VGRVAQPVVRHSRSAAARAERRCAVRQRSPCRALACRGQSRRAFVAWRFRGRPWRRSAQRQRQRRGAQRGTSPARRRRKLVQQRDGAWNASSCVSIRQPTAAAAVPEDSCLGSSLQQESMAQPSLHAPARTGGSRRMEQHYDQKIHLCMAVAQHAGHVRTGRWQDTAGSFHGVPLRHCNTDIDARLISEGVS
jgi:hypothetical protein